nr:MAG TPA: hypothetical protein [Bacteriophage sp.]
MGVGENHRQKCLWFFSYVDSRLSVLFSKILLLLIFQVLI